MEAVNPNYKAVGENKVPQVEDLDNDGILTVSVTPKRGVIKYLVVSAIVFVILIISISFFLLQRNSIGSSVSSSSSSESQVTSSISSNPLMPLENKVFYTEDKNIFSYDVSTSEVTKWTDFTSANLLAINSLQIIDAHTLGFGKCETLEGDYGCGVYTLNLDDRVVTQIEKFGAQENAFSIGFGSSDLFAYNLFTPDYYQTAYYNNGTTKVLEDFPEKAFGRDWYYLDSNKISFAPDKKHFFIINTTSPKVGAGFDASIYLYDSETYELSRISDATQPSWLDNDSILFTSLIQNKSHGLYIYHLSTNISEKVIGVGDDVYLPAVMAGSSLVAYTDYSNKVIHIYDLSTKTDRVLVNSGMQGHWVSSDHLVYSETRPCPEDVSCWLDYQVVATKLIDINNTESVETVDALKDHTLVTIDGNY